MRIRAKNPLIVARVFGKSGARFFSFRRVKFFLLAPERKSLRATFLQTANTKIPARKPTGHEMMPPVLSSD